jgi:hypothetical protein
MVRWREVRCDEADRGEAQRAVCQPDCRKARAARGASIRK